MKLYFELKKLDEKKGTIRAIISDHSIKAIISTSIKIDIKEWKDGKPKQTAKNSNINASLIKYQAAFSKYISNTTGADEIPTLSRAKQFIKANVKTANTTRGQKSLVELLELHRAAQRGKLKEGALKPYTTLINHLNDFNSKLQFADINQIMCDKFALFLTEKSKHVAGAKDLQNPSINKMIVTLKAFCNWAYQNKYTSSIDWKEIKRVKEIDQRIITLTLDEFYTYANFDFTNAPKLDKQRDVFCFATYTGLRFEDLKQINEDNIKKSGKDVYLHINTDKTLKELQLKLVEQAKNILVKYGNKLPIVSNQKTNEYIKEGVKRAGINRKETVIVQHLSKVTTVNKYIHQLISIHDARKTFVTLSLENGMSISEVMKMSTHRDYRSFSRYVELESKKISDKLQSVFALRKVV